jgi:hypothetical protein
MDDGRGGSTIDNNSDDKDGRTGCDENETSSTVERDGWKEDIAAATILEGRNGIVGEMKLWANWEEEEMEVKCPQGREDLGQLKVTLQ